MPAKTNHVEQMTPILEGTTVTVEERLVTVKGPKGEIVRDFSHADVSIKTLRNNIVVSVEYPRSRQISLVGTILSHIKNMMLGVIHGVTYKMKVVFAHFPPAVKVEGDKLVIENFYGEKAPRRAQILPGVTVSVQGDDVILEGIDIELVGQTAANIQHSTKLRRKDPRKFHDGIYVYEKQLGERHWAI
ncbi:MAG: 50S ribosomal protein L6 [Candidatus Odinarchaeota archaeon]